MENRLCGSPILFHRDGTQVKELTQLGLTDRGVQEGWLQEALRKFPLLLPLGEIEPAFGPAISIGREVPVRSGSIDNLFISPNGYLTIVETKLWRNPEARREVVGQIIDYAKDVSRWTYDELESRVKQYCKQDSGSEIKLYDLVASAYPNDFPDEPSWIDSVCRNIQRGRFLLLIVGDGIRESVEEMVSFLGRNPQLLFTLALVEIRIYRLGEGSVDDLLLIPQVVTRTREIERAVVRVIGAPIQQVQVSVDTLTEKSAGEGRRITLTEEDFFQSLAQHVNAEELDSIRQMMQDWVADGCEIDWKSASFVVKYPDPQGSNDKFSIFVIFKNGQVYSYEGYSIFSRLGLPTKLLKELAGKLGQIIPALSPHITKNGVGTNGVPIKVVIDKREELRDYVREYIQTIREKLEQNRSSS